MKSYTPECIKIKQGTPEWRQLRKKYIGASDAPIIMGVSPFVRQDGWAKTPLTLWKEKLDLLPEESPTPAMQYGLDKEEEIREIYRDLKGTKIFPKVIFHSQISYMMASLDGITEGGNQVVEIKHANEGDHETASLGNIPEKYFPQLQHQMACANVESMHYVSCHKDDVKIVEVGVDFKYLDDLYKKEEEFWKCLVNFQEPPLNDKDYRMRDEKWYESAKRLQSIKEKKKELELQEKEQEELLRKLCNGENSFFEELKYSFFERKGNVNYSKIPELSGVDLEKHRNKSSIVGRLGKF